LVRELEKRGIGRPSTYAEIISRVQQRAYVEKVGSTAFKPSDLGLLVVDGLVRSSLDFMDSNFTAQMEQDLDKVAAGELPRIELLKRFHKRFREQLEASKKLPSWKPPSEPTALVCEECSSPMIKKWGKKGWFLSCEQYPKCKVTRDLGGDGAEAGASETDYLCDKCSKPMSIRNGRFGAFLSCTGYPACRNARPIPLGVPCPKCGGDILEVRARKGGRSFYGCSNYAAAEKCDFRIWVRPVPQPCPDCHAPFLTRTGGKKPSLLCAEKECGYKRELTEEEANQPLLPTRTGIAVQLAPLPRSSESEGADSELQADLEVETPKAAAKPASTRAGKASKGAGATGAAKASVKAAAKPAKKAVKKAVKKTAKKTADPTLKAAARKAKA
jgi:DNA topoisomerase-1